MRYILIFIYFNLCTSIFSNGQAKKYQQLLNIAIKSDAHFLYSKPITSLMFSKDCIEYIFESIRDDFKNSIDTSIILEIIKINQFPDATPWKANEIKNFILVTKDSITIQSLKKLLKLTDKTKIEHYKSLLDTLYNPTICKKKIYRFSKPLFNKLKTYAIIQYENKNCYDVGVITQKLFKLKNNIWLEIGIISKWKITNTEDVMMYIP